MGPNDDLGTPDRNFSRVTEGNLNMTKIQMDFRLSEK